MTPPAYVADLKENLFGHTIFPTIRCHRFNILGVKRWGPNQPPTPPPTLPGPEDQKKPVWIGLTVTEGNLPLVLKKPTI